MHLRTFSCRPLLPLRPHFRARVAVFIFIGANLLASLGAREVAPGADGVLRFGPCHASLDGGLLRVGNGLLERTWRVAAHGSLAARSLRDEAGRIEWIGDAPATGEGVAAGRGELTAEAGAAGPTEEPSLRVQLHLRTDAGTVVHRFQVFPGVAAIVAECAIEGAPTPAAPAVARLAAVESFAPAPAGWALTRVRFFDRTDLYAGPLVIERPGLAVTADDANDAELLADGGRFRGNVFFIEDPQSAAGVLWLKHAALPDERPAAMDEKGAVVRRLFDLTIAHGRLRLDSHELGAAGGRTYRTVALVYQGGRAGRIAVLQRYHRHLRTYEPGRDGLMLCNFWGEWNSNKNLSGPFLVREIDAAARLGVDVFEIDAGWQHGPYPNPIDRKKRDAVGHYGTHPRYWDFHPERFPQGIKPFVAQARARGLKFGIWFPPDSFNELDAWEKDKARVLELHAAGADYFKFDLLRVTTRRAEDRLHRLIEDLLQATDGRLTIDLDVTGGHTPRPGYFGNPHHGPIFVENRWTHYPQAAPMPNPNEYWPRKDRYFPHRTLRNLWLLGQYLDPVRLRMEFMNNLRQAENYGDDPLAPAHWSPDYVFATVMCSSPLAWMEVQQLPEAYVQQVAPLVAVWKAHRAAMFHGNLIPVGAEPDGHAWTGFISAAADGAAGYALIFRELNDRGRWACPLPLLGAGNYEVTRLAGQGTAQVTGGQLQVEMPAARSFVFLQLQRKSSDGAALP